MRPRGDPFLINAHGFAGLMGISGRPASSLGTPWSCCSGSNPSGTATPDGLLPYFLHAHRSDGTTSQLVLCRPLAPASSSASGCTPPSSIGSSCTHARNIEYGMF
ncbi:hypothetical protein D1007_37037 [Hordeum vulgare]|nr:hypothetical protein D1007_37037 [Hordeum vulgare]